MRTLHVIAGLLLLFSCQQEKHSSLTGSITTASDIRLHSVILKGCDTTFTLQPDSNGRFTLRFPARGLPFFNLYGIVEKEDGNKWQLNSPVYLAPGKEHRMDISVKDYQTGIKAEDNGNKALQLCREAYTATGRRLWALNDPMKIKGIASVFQQKADSVLAALRPDPAVSGFIRTWGQVEYYNALSMAERALWNENRSVPEDFYAGIPAIPEVLDKPYWNFLTNSFYLILKHLRRKAETPEGELAVLYQDFKTPSILREIRRQIAEHFISTYPYSEENMQRLEKLGSGLDGFEKLMEQYRNRRYALPGAPMPDVCFEDRQGGKHRLTDFKGKYLYIDLWASWCVPCCSEVPHLQKLEKELKNEKVVFISISLDKNRSAWEERLDRLDMHGNQWIMTDETFAEMLNVSGIPHFLIYDKEGKLMDYKADRPSSGNRLKGKLEALQ